MDFGIAETGIARGSPPGTTTEVLRFGIPFAEIRVVSNSRVRGDLQPATQHVSLSRGDLQPAARLYAPDSLQGLPSR
jgi:hypothetical protein